MRITDIIKNDNMVQNLGRHQIEFDKVQNQLSTGKRIRRPSESPSDASNQMYFRTRLKELKQFENNIGEGKTRLNLVDGQLGQLTDILQRIRVLTVQAANGIYQGDNFFALKHAIAKEVDQHLESVLDLANAKDVTGRSLFGGHDAEGPAFVKVLQSSGIDASRSLSASSGAGLDQDQIVEVRYRGNIGQNLREIERGQYMSVNVPGNRAFWATNITITGSVDNEDYSALSEQSFRLNGTEIKVALGDTVDDIIEKINRVGIEIRADKVGQNYLSLHSTSAHQPWLEDVGNSTVLKDLGLLSNDPLAKPNEYSESATVSGLSIFDMIIKLRDDLTKGDQLEIGGRDLGNIDSSINNVLRHRADVGARVNRLESHEKKVAWDSTHMTELLAESEGIDFPETIMNLKWLETVHNYALNVGARIIRPKLLDFIR